MKKSVITFFFLGLVSISYAENVKKSVDNLRAFNNDENGDSDESKDVAMEIPEADASEKKPQLCSARRQNHHMHPIMNATARQFPFMVSCLSLSEEHLCSGTIVANGLILTTASCIDKQINAVLVNTLTTKHSPKDSSVRVSVIKSDKFPSYNGMDSLNNVGLVYTHRFNASFASKIRISNYTSAQNLVDVTLLGFGLNYDVGTAGYLQYIGVEHRYYQQPANRLHCYIDCVESKEPVCFSDQGGPAIFGNEVVGIVIIGVADCIDKMTPNFAINKEIAIILPTFSFKAWVDDKITQHEEKKVSSIPTYPQKLVEATNLEAKSVRRAEGEGDAKNLRASIFTYYLLCVFSLYVR